MKDIKCGDSVFAYCETLNCVLEYWVDTITQQYYDRDTVLVSYVADSYKENELLDSIDFDDDDVGKTVFFTYEEAAAKDIANMSYSEFTQLLADDAEDRFKIILDYEDFDVYLDKVTLRYFYLEKSENDASDFFELELIATLNYSVVNDLKIKDGAVLSTFFDCDVCGENVEDKGITYLWFKRC